jgi:hypothetical protein
MNPPKIGRRFHNWRSFEEARAYAQSLGLKNGIEWQAWAKSGARPDDIPSNPGRVYKNNGWVSLGDWLGTGHIEERRRIFRTFEDARSFVRSLGLKNESEWRAWVKSSEFPDDIPAFPRRFYKGKGWAGLQDWLGSIRIRKREEFRPFVEARKYARNLELKNQHEWQAWAKSGARSDDIPASPREIYAGKGWVILGDWLGTDHIAYQKKVYRPFSEARAYVRSLGLKNYYEWKAWAKSPERPDDIPVGAHRTYKDKGWAGWGDWLGNGRRHKNGWRSFEDARNYVHSLGLKSNKEWIKWCKSGSRPDDIPFNPSMIYKGKGWISMDDWLGTFK